MLLVYYILEQYEAKLLHQGHVDELKEGDILDGVVRNVVAFGAFVDVGLKNDGLVHISELADTFVKNPMDIVQVGDKVRVRLTGIDKQKGKIQLSMKNI